MAAGPIIMYRRSSFRYRYRREEPHNPVPQPGDARRCTPAGGSRAVPTNRCAYGIPKRLQEPIPECPARGCRSPETAVPGFPFETGVFGRHARVERALTGAISESYLQDVSTGRIRDMISMKRSGRAPNIVKKRLFQKEFRSARPAVLLLSGITTPQRIFVAWEWNGSLSPRR